MGLLSWEWWSGESSGAPKGLRSVVPVAKASRAVESGRSAGSTICPTLSDAKSSKHVRASVK